MNRSSGKPRLRAVSRSLGATVAVCAALPLLIGGCLASNAPSGHAIAVGPATETNGALIEIAANSSWTDSGVEVVTGEPVSVSASGQVIVRQQDRWGQGFEMSVGPEGTFAVADAIQDQKFPLPSGNHGPAPCFCLIGRIGNGPPFFIGRQLSWIAPASGRLFLTVNDFDPLDSKGAFHAQISRPDQMQPVAYEEVVNLAWGKPSAGPNGIRQVSAVPSESESRSDSVTMGRPWIGCRAVVFYVDGLRPDVVREMATMGHLPHIKQMFLDNGCWMSNCFTAFPSDTITSNGTMWTGCFSDRHGLKGQVRFSRQRLVSESYLDPLGPSRSARMLSPQGVDRALIDGQASVRKFVAGDREGEIWKHSLTSDIAPIYEILRQDGRDWATGVLPVMTESPPPLWSRSLARSVPYFKAHEAWRHIDDANTNYAIRQLLPREQPVTIIWMPETDSVSHKECRGQFGATRRTIANADRLIGQIVAETKAQGWQDTYFFLVSDHGHHGGRTGHLSHFDVAHELLYRPREIDSSGKWIGGGLGVSIRQHREFARHTGDGKQEFVFIDGDSDGVARLFFPKGHYHSGDWSGPNRPGDLLAYRLADHLPPINLVDTITSAQFARPPHQQAEHSLSPNPGPDRSPIDLVLMKLSEQSVLISTNDRGQAVIERMPLARTSAGTIRWGLRYSVVTDVRSAGYGEVAYSVVENPINDPLGLVELTDREFLRDWHDETEWLYQQANSRYPDSVVSLSRHLLWQPNIQPQEADAASDLVITARPGWYFGNDSSPGTMHGYPLADSMRACWFVHGPNIRRGTRIDLPCRLADLTPTLLDIVGTRANFEHFDGRPVRAMYDPAIPHNSPLPFGPRMPQLLGIETAAAVDARGFQETSRPETTKNPERNSSTSRGGDIQLASGNTLKAVFWDSVDLHAWPSVHYEPIADYPQKPLTINHPASPYDLHNMAYNGLLIAELSVFRVLDDVISPLAHPRRPFVEMTDRIDLALRHSSKPWVSRSANVLDLTHAGFLDHRLTSLGNFRRMNSAVDYLQQRGHAFEERLFGITGPNGLAVANLTHKSLDQIQAGFWSVYGFGQRVLAQTFDETLVQGFENSTDRVLNIAHPIPAEIRVPSTDR